MVNAAGRLRAYSIRKDLAAVADLIERCFEDTLDPDGERYLRHMRRAASSGTSLLSSVVLGRTSLPTTGYVWEDQGRIVANLTLIPFTQKGKKIYLIANVAVEQAYRRKGIARALTRAAIERAQRLGAKAIWLQVRHDNPPAYQLYRGLGFQPQAIRTTWQLSPSRVRTLRDGEATSLAVEKPGRVVRLRGRDWRKLSTWLDDLYPPQLRWNMLLRPHTMRPGLWGDLTRALLEFPIFAFGVQLDNRLCGALYWQATHHYADLLWLAAAEEHLGLVLTSAFLPMLRRVRTHRPISLELPHHLQPAALTQIGFTARQTLVWMRYADLS